IKAGYYVTVEIVWAVKSRTGSVEDTIGGPFAPVSVAHVVGDLLIALGRELDSTVAGRRTLRMPSASLVMCCGAPQDVSVIRSSEGGLACIALGNARALAHWTMGPGLRCRSMPGGRHPDGDC
ncbi:MAG: hypothetical protein QOH85_512, partial [Acidobacteriaceae bacterium]|nr:hypothetical protein [Acidobacteriaceae bacterium]